MDAYNRASGDSGRSMLLLVDQFEEIFRFAREVDAKAAREFVELILAASEKKWANIYVVLTMRSDFLGDCIAYSGLPEAMNSSQFLTPRLTRLENKLAIECPISLYDATIRSDVVNRILNEMNSDDPKDQLSLMQHLLMRMWSIANNEHDLDTNSQLVLTMDDYDVAGGFKYALSNHVQSTYENLSSQQKEIAEVVFRQLTEITKEKQIIRRDNVTVDSLQKSCGVSLGKIEEVLDEFRMEGRSFLMPPKSENAHLLPSDVIDISHESLIRQWENTKTVDVRRRRDAQNGLGDQGCHGSLGWMARPRVQGRRRTTGISYGWRTTRRGAGLSRKISKPA